MAGATLLGVWLLGVWLAWAPSAAADTLPVTEVAPGVFVHAGLHEETDAANAGDIANCGFIVGDDAVAVIDTGGSPAVGRRLREAIRARTNRPIRYVVNTHMHPDHALGNAAFLADQLEAGQPDFVAHRNFQAALMGRGSHYLHAFDAAVGPEAAAEVRIVPPTVTVADRLELDLGRRVVELVARPVAHTDNDLTVFDRQTATLWTGDLLFMERAPAIDGSVLGWLRLLDGLAAEPAARVVPGHGPPSAPWPEAATDLRRYLDRVVTGVRAIQSAHGTIQQAVDTVAADEAPRWRLFDAYNPRNVTAAFAELEWE
ncbi:quinoprotein relay system zinc metallohydrolase 2 [Azospirillum rugosum]|uniref:Quinoprotein relay system zinc metallohydrolase 2 n=1 Tax=Azospirillum rugosum TaxID=416170 RepID=A0ABS4SUP3_9PROT|nr:quinoprotein relay system zinc metallohydrolase 2 [Azospirillum rugosum]MBP2296279.1 quinoprotein relay system zinc metallohydrolase 2 [Azospirillum rugosum]MDQ0529800.1 quinoprotein relay system zinc metallohydrolase 2 [Azospirillum rugosum]